MDHTLLQLFYDQSASSLNPLEIPRPSGEQKCSIVGIGVSVWDSILLIDSFPESGAVVQATRRIEGVGGGITVAMATAARLGSATAMIDSLGDDAAADRIVQTLSDAGVSTELITRNCGETSSVASIWAEKKSAERTIAFLPGSASGMLEWTDEMERVISQASVIHLNGRHPDVCLYAIRLAKSRGIKVSFDGGAYRYRDEILPMLRSADIAIVARHFAESHFRNQTGAKQLPELTGLCDFLFQDLSCEIAGVTAGAAGSFLIGSTGERIHQPAIGVQQAIDTTGCGDTYHGALLHALVCGRGLKESAAMATKIASENARQMGALAF